MTTEHEPTHSERVLRVRQLAARFTGTVDIEFHARREIVAKLNEELDSLEEQYEVQRETTQKWYDEAHDMRRAAAEMSADLTNFAQKYGLLEEQLETAQRERDSLAARLRAQGYNVTEILAHDAAYPDGLLEQLDALAKIGFALVHDNMHFHERAMADPFEAESYVQGEGQRILDITGMPSNVTVIDVASDPAEGP